MERIKTAMVSEGHDPHSLRFPFDAADRYRAERKDDLTFKQRQQLAKWLGLAWAGGRSAPSTVLTQEELAYLAERISGANDAVGQSALTKILLLIK